MHLIRHEPRCVVHSRPRRCPLTNAGRVQAKGTAAARRTHRVPTPAARSRGRLRNADGRLRPSRPAPHQTRPATQETRRRPARLGPVPLRGRCHLQARRIRVHPRRQRSGTRLLRRRGRRRATAAARCPGDQSPILG